MTAAEQVEVLMRGDAAWNRHRREHPEEGAPDLSGLQFGHADLSRFDLSGVGFQRAYLRGACLRGACLAAADLQSAYLIDGDLERADLSHARLVAANFNGANLSGCSFSAANLREADLGGADLTGADFQNADLLGANLLGANLNGARFVQTKGLSSRQVMAARNWHNASFSPELAAGLALPYGSLDPSEAGSRPDEGAERIDSSGPLALSCALDPSLG